MALLSTLYDNIHLYVHLSTSDIRITFDAISVVYYYSASMYVRLFKLFQSHSNCFVFSFMFINVHSKNDLLIFSNSILTQFQCSFSCCLFSDRHNYFSFIIIMFIITLFHSSLIFAFITCSRSCAIFHRNAFTT